MLVCPSCSRLYTDGSSVCREDGVFLKHRTDSRTGLRVGNYLLMGVLGDGGMGKVYRGEHVLIGKEVAIKVLHPRFIGEEQVVERFLMEAKAASMIRHPNIIDVTDFGKLPDGCSFFVMEFLEGPDLAEEIQRNHQLPIYRAVNIMSQVCQALDACHQKGIFHRDLKPENVVLIPRTGHRDLVWVAPDATGRFKIEPEGTYDHVKLLDFGVASIQELTADLDQDTLDKGMVFGSPAYISPEQAQGKPSDHRADIYAIGVIFFEMLTGTLPFSGDTARDVMVAHVRTPIPGLRTRRPDLELPPEAEAVIHRAMAKKPTERHRDVRALLAELQACFGDIIYGRDIGRYLEVRQTRPVPIIEPEPEPEPEPPPAMVAAGERPELQELFEGCYSEPQAITGGAMSQDPEVEAERHARAELRSELKQLFTTEEDGF